MTTCATKERSCGRCTAPWRNYPADGKNQLPENNGKPWTEELDDELCRLFDGGMKRKTSVRTLAAPPARSSPGWSGWGTVKLQKCNINVAPQATKPSFGRTTMAA